ncbi:MAG: deoxyribonuclease IV [Isosphaeraceae bacterium]
MPILGAHMSVSGGYFKAVDAAAALEMGAVQIFTHSPSQWAVKPDGAGGWAAPPLAEDQVKGFRNALMRTGLSRPLAHTSYLINLGTPDEALWQKSIAGLVAEIERAGLLGIEDLVHHPGSHVGSGQEAGLKRVADGLRIVLDRTRGSSVRVDLENTAGQGSCLGASLEDLGRIIDLIGQPDEGRLGICLDTCHLFAAGYSLDPLPDYNAVIDEVARTSGIERIRVWHLNDSQKDRGSRVDRHAAIGQGKLGLGPFRHVLNDARFAALPMVLETPKGKAGCEDLDLINLRVLQRLLAEGPIPA